MGRRNFEIEALFDREYAPLVRLAFLLTRNENIAEEIAMEAFVRALGGWRRIGSMERPDLYVRRIVVNLCASSGRRKLTEGRMMLRLRAQTRESYSHTHDDPSITPALQSLPVRQRACIVLRYFEDRSEAEMAEILSCSVGTVKSQLAKARAKLETELRPLVAMEGERDE